MKKSIILAAACAMVTVNLLAQNNSTVSGAVHGRFDALFPGASVLTWKKLDKGITSAQFVQGNRDWLAYFDADAKLIVSGRKIKSNEPLPIRIANGIEARQRRIERKYGDLFRFHTFEMVSDKATTYYTTLTNSSVSVVLATTPDGHCFIASKEIRKAPHEIQPVPKNVIAKGN